MAHALWNSDRGIHETRNPRGLFSDDGERELDDFVASPLGQRLSQLADLIKHSSDAEELAANIAANGDPQSEEATD